MSRFANFLRSEDDEELADPELSAAMRKLGSAKEDDTSSPSDFADYPKAPTAPPMVASQPAARSVVDPYVEALKKAQGEDADAAKKADVSDALYSAFVRRPMPASSPGPSKVAALKEQQGAEADATARAKRAEMEDPNSDVSRRARAMFKGLDIGSKFSQHLGADYERLPASQLPGLEKLMEVELRKSTDDPTLREHRRAQVLEINAKLSEQDRKRRENLAYLDAVKKKYPQLEPVLKDAPGLSEGALGKLVDSIEAQTKFGRDLTKLDKEQGFTGEQKSLDREAELGKENRKEEREFKTREIPGWQQTGAVRVSDTESKDLRDANANLGSLSASIGTLANLVQNNGFQLAAGPLKAKAESIMRDLQLQAKNKSNYELGVLSGPDLGLLEQVTGNPTSAWQAIFGGKEAFLARLATMLHQSRQRVAEKMKASGYAPAGQAAPRAPPSASGGGKVRVSNGKETREIDPGDLAAAEAEGYKRAP